jgi:hypothetical protein
MTNGFCVEFDCGYVIDGLKKADESDGVVVGDGVVGGVLYGNNDSLT